MEERARYGSRKFLSFSATRRKELSVGHNGQVAISFTRRIPRPSVLHEDKKNIGRFPSSSVRKEKNIVSCCELGGFSRTEAARNGSARRRDVVEFSPGREVRNEKFNSPREPELFSTEYFRRSKHFTLPSSRRCSFSTFDIFHLKTLSSHASDQLMRCFMLRSLTKNLTQMHRHECKFYVLTVRTICNTAV